MNQQSNLPSTQLRAVIRGDFLQKIWKKSVRDGLRNQEIIDLHDYLDVHRTLKDRLERIRLEVLDGTYRPRPPETVRVEKSLGVVRRIILPAPVDALVLQALCEALEPYARQAQPSKNSYYTRSHGGQTVEDFEAPFAYPWWILWPHFQRRIWRFVKATEYTVISDIANYFDSIPLRLLRNKVASLGQIDQEYLDFLFYMLEHYVWRPKYAPHSQVGLPQINFDAPRLLGHTYLFTLDAFLTNECEGNFVRWMDDIDFGVDSRQEGKRILGEVDNLLHGLGVRLNLSKTRILSSAEASAHFWLDANMALNVFSNILRTMPELLHNKLRRQARVRFDRFYGSNRIGVWEKVFKRFWTLFGRLRDDYLEHLVTETLNEMPSIRASVFRYYAQLGYAPHRAKRLLAFLSGGHCIDDYARFQAAQVIVNWKVPRASFVRRKIVAVALKFPCGTRRDSISFCAALWLLAKYGSAGELSDYVANGIPCWRKSEWASRQVAAVRPRLTPETQRRIADVFHDHGLLEGLSVFSHSQRLAKLESLDRQLKSYLLHPVKEPYNYPLPKILVLLTVLGGQLRDSDRKTLLTSVGAQVDDPLYQALAQEFGSSSE